MLVPIPLFGSDRMALLRLQGIRPSLRRAIANFGCKINTS
jgi:hypothetical protein